MKRPVRLACAVVLLSLSCGAPGASVPEEDAGTGEADAGFSDPVDAGAPDGGEQGPDAGSAPDAGPGDAGAATLDAG